MVDQEVSGCVFSLARQVAGSSVKVLLQGETGVGKTLVAQFIHNASPRASEPFLALNCGALPENLIEAELFGYAPGAFTGAGPKGKRGLLELAHHGTLFLDEIGDLPLSVQVKLLKVIEENRFIPVSGLELKEVDVRIISATHHDLKQLVAQKRFRADLYYRLLGVALSLTLLIQGYVSVRLGILEARSQRDLGIAGVIGAVLAIKEASWAFGVGVVLCLLIYGKNFFKGGWVGRLPKS